MKIATVIPTALVSALAVSFVLVSAARSQPARRPASDGTPRTVVVELFTSQGCSSCPPADELLSRLGREQIRGVRIIPLAFHVDYWNSLGWADPFSSSLWSARQRDYARALHSDQVYTPQLVMNGTEQMVGSDERRVRQQVESDLSRPDQGSVSFDRVTSDGSAIRADLHGRLERALAGRDTKVIVALYENNTSTAVGRGENSGRRLVNDYIVRSLVSAFPRNVSNAGSTRGSVVIPLRPEWKRDNLGLVAFVQDSRSLSIYAAAARRVEPAATTADRRNAR
jgi:hypothetical protein